MAVTITKTITKRVPNIQATLITEKIAGKNYNLSLVFVGEKRARSLNQTYRQKDYIPNVLSFPLDNQTGEIFICPNVAKKEARGFDLSYADYLRFLLIHGLLHLKGYLHGATMERLERKYMRAFSIS